MSYKLNLQAFSTIIKLRYDIGRRLPENRFFYGYPGLTLRAETVDIRNDTTFLNNVLLYKKNKNEYKVFVSKKGKIYNYIDDQTLAIELLEGNTYKDFQRDSLEYMKTKFKTIIFVCPLSQNKNYQRELIELKENPLMKNVNSIQLGIDKRKQEVQKLNDIMANGSKYGKGAIERIDAAITWINKEEEIDNYRMLIERSKSEEKELMLKVILSNTIRQKEKEIISGKIEILRKSAFAISNIIFFLLGLIISSKVKKGRVGESIMTSTVVYVLFYLLFEFFETLALNEKVTEFWATFAPLFILAIPWLFYIPFKKFKSLVLC